jgi:hypothetical protein
MIIKRPVVSVHHAPTGENFVSVATYVPINIGSTYRALSFVRDDRHYRPIVLLLDGDSTCTPGRRHGNNVKWVWVGRYRTGASEPTQVDISLAHTC